MDRGDRLEAIYRDDRDREIFCKTLAEATGRAGWKIHSYVLMDNHYHLLLETPEANLSVGMQWMQATYTIRHNARHRVRGHLFQGRYKAMLVDGDSDGYFLTASDYIYLNPVRAGLIADDLGLESFRWSNREAMERRVDDKRMGGSIDEEDLKALRQGWCFGSEEFRLKILDDFGGMRKRRGPAVRFGPAMTSGKRSDWWYGDWGCLV